MSGEMTNVPTETDCSENRGGLRKAIVEIYLRLLGDLGLDHTVLVHHNQTQGFERAAARLQQAPLPPGQAGAGRNKAERHIRGGIATRKKYRGVT